MKKVRKLWLGGMVLAMVVAATCGIVAGCGKAKGKLTLEEGNGGTLSATEYKVEVGANLKDFLADKAPVPEEGLTFAGWYLNGAPMEDGATMSKDGVTLTAKYNVTYTLNVYTMDVDGNYPETASVQTAEGLYLEPLDLTSSLNATEGFEVDDGKQNVLSVGSLGKDAVFTVYLEREQYSLRYVADLPEGYGEASDKVVSHYYDTKENAIDGDVYGKGDALYLEGWATEAGGEIVYRVGDEITVKGDIVLHAVWSKGIRDLMGGADVVYLLSSKPGSAVLNRGGVKFEGTVAEDKDSVTFSMPDGKSYVVYLYTDGFAAYHENFEGTYEYYDRFYAPAGVTREKKTLVLDGKNAATLTVGEGADAKTYKGTYSFEMEQEHFRFVSDEIDFYFMLGVTRTDNKPVFSLYYPEEDGSFEQFIVLDPVEGLGYSGDYVMELDGSGHAVIHFGDEEYVGTYFTDYWSDDEDDNTLYGAVSFENGDGETQEWWFLLIELTDGSISFIKADPIAMGIFQGEVDGQAATLELDGFANTKTSACLTIGEKAVYGSYSVVTQLRLLGGVVVELEMEDGSSYSFRVHDEAFEEFDLNFTEYYWIDNGDLPQKQLLVLYEDPVTGIKDETGKDVAAKRAEVYLYAEDREKLVHAAKGYYVAQPYGDVTIYEYVEQEKDAAYTGDAFYQNIRFLVGGISSGDESYDVFYLLSSDYGTEDQVIYFEAYYEYEVTKDGNVYTGNGLLYNKNGDPGITGMGSLYFEAVKDGKGEITSYNAYEGSVALFDLESDELASGGSDHEQGPKYLEFAYYYVNEDDLLALGTRYFMLGVGELEGNVEVNIARPLKYEPVDLTYTDADGSMFMDYFSMTLDGTGAAVWNIYELDDSSWWPSYEFVASVNGTAEITGKTEFGDEIYHFVPETNTYGVKEISFIIEYYIYEYFGRPIPYWLLHEQVCEQTTLVGEDGSSLKIDGFTYWAEYRDADGETFEGTYYYGVTEDDETDMNVIEFWGEDGRTHMKADLGETYYTVRDGYDGDYEIWSDAKAWKVPYKADEDSEVSESKLIARLDGHGNVQIVRDDDGVVLAEGAYAIDHETFINTLSVSWNNGKDSAECQFAFVLDEYDYVNIVIRETEHVSTLVDEDGEVFVLDGLGFVTYYDALGVRHEGAQYTELSDGAWIILLDSSTSLFVVEIEGEGVVNCKVVDNSAYKATFYASDFSAIVFLDTVVRLDGVPCYYNVSEDGKTATIYRQNDDGSYTASTLTMPALNAATYSYNEKTFTRWTENRELTFTSTGEFAGITLKFTPDGTDTFEIPAFFLNDSYTEMSVDHYYMDYYDAWQTELVYGDSDDWYYITLNYNFETNVGTFTFRDEEEEKVTYTSQDGSVSLILLEGDWQESILAKVVTGEASKIVFIEGGLYSHQAEAATETQNAIYAVEIDGTKYRFYTDKTSEKNILEIAAA